MPILLIAIVFFIVLLIAGVYLEELSWKQVVVWVAIAVVAYVGLVWFVDESANLFSAALAVIDVVLAVIIFKEYVGRL
ncbi:MAG TPA: hypothetical protein VFX97_11245 [Pyrinomonadaceae bacterium]|nr:hypothetical protein [Pyrinomonadaceae bacterium]